MNYSGQAQREGFRRIPFSLSHDYWVNAFRCRNRLASSTFDFGNVTNLKHGDVVFVDFFSDELLSGLLHLPAIQLFFHGGIGWFLSLTQERKKER